MSLRLLYLISARLCGCSLVMLGDLKPCRSAMGAPRAHRRRRGRAKAQVAIARSILVIIWHLLTDPAARFTDLGPDYYASRTDKDKKIRNQIRQLQALSMDVTITPAA